VCFPSRFLRDCRGSAGRCLDIVRLVIGSPVADDISDRRGTNPMSVLPMTLEVGQVGSRAERAVRGLYGTVLTMSIGGQTVSIRM
jgi:hypothetical protein